MKRFFLTFSLCALFAFGAMAQGLSGGLKVGANIANMKMKSGGESETGDSKIGFLAGGYLTAMLSDKVGIQPELFYSSMGSKDSEFDYNFEFGYISLPVLLRYNINEMVNIHLGPQIGFLISSKLKADGASVDFKDYTESLDFGVAGGIGLDFGKFNAGARYYQGVSNVGSDEFFDGEDASLKNSAFQIFAGIKLFGE